MLGRLRALASRTWFPPAALAAAGLALFASALAQIWLVDDPSAHGWGGPRWLSTAVAAAAIVPISLVRRRPVEALAVSFCAGTVLNVVLTAPAEGAFQTFVAALVLAFGVGAHVEGRASAAAIGALLAATVVTGVAVRVGQEYPSGEFVPILVWFGTTWLVGRFVRSWRLRAEELEVLARRLAEEQEARAREAVGVERLRIARELHDVIAHNVSVVSVQAAAAERVLEGEQPVVREALGSIQATARSTIDEMRRMLGVLRAIDEAGRLAPLPGLADLDALAEQARAAGLSVDVRVEGTPPALPAGLELSAYRIIQEGLTNAIKHGGDSRAAVTVRYVPDALELEVVDDGSGNGSGGGTGNGLAGIRERVGMFSGELEAGPRDGGGWRLRARLPLLAP
jgi:signal transduction histidine kinase